MKYEFKTTAKISSAGVTLVELIITIALSLSLVLGTSFIYASSRNQQQLMFATSTAVDNTRLGLINMTNMLKMAGYYSLMQQGGGASQEKAYPKMDASLIKTLPTSRIFAEGQYVLGISQQIATKDVDQVFIRVRGYEGDAIKNCGGIDILQDQMAVMQFYIDTDKNLVCSVITINVSPSLSVPIASSPVSFWLIKNIDRLKILYGVNAKQLGSSDMVPSDWLEVSNIALSMVVLTERVTVPIVDPTETVYHINFLGQVLDINGSNTPAIKSAHAIVFDQSVYLRNAVAGGG